MPPTPCVLCREKRAVVKRPKNHDKVCRDCFITVFENEVHHTIISSNLFYPGERIAIGASGGKDSTVLASVLKTLNERHGYGLDLVLLSVDEGIRGYRDDSLQTVKRNATQYEMPLKIVGYDELYGWTMDQVVETIGKKGNCTYCGVFRRQALDRGAKLLSIKHVVTGHNADDVAETILMNLLRGDLPRLSRSTSIITGNAASEVKRSKPLKYAYEKEIVLYAHHKKLDYFSTECIYSPEAFRGTARSLIKSLEKIRPSAILDIVRSGEDMARLTPDKGQGGCDCGGDDGGMGGCSSASASTPGGVLARAEEGRSRDENQQKSLETEITPDGTIELPSVLLSEDAEYETADSFADNATESTAVPVVADSTVQLCAESDEEDEDDQFSDRDASGEEIDDDAYIEDENDTQIIVGHVAMQGEEDGDAEDLDEAVGAVKIKPGESFHDEDAESDVSDLPSADSDDEVAWEEEDAADEDDDSEAASPNTCMFCKQDEENDPSEDFEAFLDCISCGDNAHQQCARDAAAMTERNHSKAWKCPECCADDSDADDGDANMNEDASVDENVHSLSQQSSATEPPREPSKSEEPPESSAAALESDAADGGRALRKRKTSSAEPEEVEVPSRKRRRNLSSSETIGHDDGGANQSGESNKTPRVLRLKAQRPPLVVVEKKTRSSLVVRMSLRPGNLKEILKSRKKPERKRPGTAPRPAPQPPRATPVRPATIPTPVASLPTPFTSDLCSQPFYSLFDKETDDVKGKPYGGILTEAEADTSKTLPTPEDRKRFDQAKQKAEDEWRARVLAMQAEAEVPVRKAKKQNDNASHIECVEFGGWEIDTWYAAPYPAEYSRNRVLYICEFCLKYMNSDYVAWRHKLKCAAKHPPGDEIYRHESVSIFEVDGRKHPVYCQNLCLLAKLFLGSKTLYYDVEPFLFYILCEYDERGYHFVGYFSKEKRASSQNNVSCILTLPIHQRKGYGNLLIDFSYLLTRTEQKTGSPEKPLSDMGLVSYRNYWRLELCRYLLNVTRSEAHKRDGLSIRSISDDTGMTPDDVVSALEGLRALVRDPQTQLYAFRVDLDYCRQYVAKWESKGYVRLKPEALAWTPYVMGRSNAVNFEFGPPISTVAPREDDEAKVLEVSGTESQPANGDGAVSPRQDGDVKAAGGGPEPVKSIETVASEDKENAEPRDKDNDKGDGDGDGDDDNNNNKNGDDVSECADWQAMYRDIPPTRFEVFPPVGGGRRGDRARQGVGRSAIGRTGSGSSRPRRAGGSSGSGRRHATSSRRSSTSRRKTGGTGRGPGRWPKGTKKSDYGNADSGPGLPPGWKEKQARMKAEAEGRRADTDQAIDDRPAQDEVQVVVARPPSNGKIANVKDGHVDEDGVVGAQMER
ncbi:hypothetical protein L249_3330 [Ophiocordyceps polyrhachis-furcata BCC 54312]|uniref:Cytoplasmic tRNA 2-thiolation protein 1 n=1 Tax=Ophiocordyceps polyrhachis-furcata BCC 54312 TaxID=1330021 RepID=A0A367LQB0_9HYPO|nr:hypothetical protein L249_3330 [Ophiocordyceps polyrhachis-furcata BCC 54312]